MLYDFFDPFTSLIAEDQTEVKSNCNIFYVIRCLEGLRAFWKPVEVSQEVYFFSPNKQPYRQQKICCKEIQINVFSVGFNCVKNAPQTIIELSNTFVIVQGKFLVSCCLKLVVWYYII